MPCIDKIAADILNSCDTIPRGGFETVAWAINREDIDTITYDSTYDTLIEAITMDSGTWAYNVTAVKKEMNAGFDLVTGDDIPDTYAHYFSFKPYEKTAAAITNLDSMNDLVIIAELKGSKTEGCFVIFGLEKGLYKNAGSQRQNDSNGLPIYEMQSQEGQGERYSRYIFWDTDYATSKAALESLIVSYGPELLSNPDFSAWTADDPDGWTVTGESGVDPMVTEVATNMCRMYSSAANVQIAQSGVMTIGQPYRMVVVVDAADAGAYKFGDGSGDQDTISTPGTHILDFTAAGITALIRRSSGAGDDMTFISASLKLRT